jgi:peptidoglycan/LPS O-acetylase OafA/YrhL
LKATATLAHRLNLAGGRPAGFDYIRLALSLSIICWHTIAVTLGQDTEARFFTGWVRPPVAMLLPMFFALSGFLVTGSLERTKSLPGFLGLRVLRIVPALSCEVILSALLLGTVFTTLPLHAYFASPVFATYFMNILGEPHYALPGVFLGNPLPGRVNPQLWTIPYELLCYVVLAALALAGLLRRRWLLPAAALGVQLLLTYLALVGLRDPVGGVTGLTLLAAFLFGVVLFRFRDVVPWHPALGLLALAVAVLLFLVPNGDRFCALPVAYFTAWVGLHDPPRLRRLLGGDYSYGLYLYGAPIQQALAAAGLRLGVPLLASWYGNLLVAIPCAFLVATLSWWFVEKPALRLRRYITAFEAWYVPYRDAALAALPMAVVRAPASQGSTPRR